MGKSDAERGRAYVVAVHSGRCMQRAEEYMMYRGQVNCADTEEQLTTGKLGQKICIRFRMVTGR